MPPEVWALVGVVIGALASGGAAVIVAWINQSAEEAKRKAEDRRWLADHYLPKKLEAVTNLYTAVVAFHTATSRIPIDPLAHGEWTEATFYPAQDRVTEARGFALAYVDDATMKLVDASVNAIVKLHNSVISEAKGERDRESTLAAQKPWFDEYDAGLVALRAELNPPLLSDILKAGRS